MSTWVAIGIGVLLIPAIKVGVSVTGLFCRAARSTVHYWRHGLMPGYRWWNWIWLTPLIWWNVFKDQCAAWWNGYSIEYMFKPVSAKGNDDEQ